MLPCRKIGSAEAKRCMVWKSVVSDHDLVQTSWMADEAEAETGETGETREAGEAGEDG